MFINREGTGPGTWETRICLRSILLAGQGVKYIKGKGVGLRIHDQLVHHSDCCMVRIMLCSQHRQPSSSSQLRI